MSSQRLARIRKAEEEKSEAVLARPRKTSCGWVMTTDARVSCPTAAPGRAGHRDHPRVRPDVLLSVDPGQWYTRWHKTDHRYAAFNTADAIGPLSFWLYFPNQKLQLGLQPYRVRRCTSFIRRREK